MAGDTIITVIGNLTDAPELRFTPSGVAVANFTVASTPRAFDKATNEWKDGDTLFLRTSFWRQQAEHIAESLKKGDRVVVTGRLVQRSYETKEKEKRTVYELQGEEVGASLLFRSFVHGAGGKSRAAEGGKVSEPDPWATAQGSDQYKDEPPF
jgi:single-strand DNA-binding protein